MSLKGASSHALVNIKINQHGKINSENVNILRSLAMKCKKGAVYFNLVFKPFTVQLSNQNRYGKSQLIAETS